MKPKYKEGDIFDTPEHGCLEVVSVLRSKSDFCYRVEAMNLNLLPYRQYSY